MPNLAYVAIEDFIRVSVEPTYVELNTVLQELDYSEFDTKLKEPKGNEAFLRDWAQNEDCRQRSST